MTLLLARMTSRPPDLASLYDAHARRVWRTLSHLGVPAHRVEDAVQDVFLTAHQRLADFKGRSSALTWLLGIAVRVAANARRSERPTLVMPELATDETPHAVLEQRRRLAVLDRVLGQLPTEQREVVVLIDLERLSAPDVAELLGAKLNTIYSRLRLGRAALTRAVAEEESR